MSEPEQAPEQGPEQEPSDALIEAERRRRRARVFGDVLPEGTGDERGEGWGDRSTERDSGEEWLRRQVPPHHG